MSDCDWIICEQSSSWAAAFRTALESDIHSDGCRHRLREVRSLAELSESLAARPASLAAVEVRHANLNDVLPWLAATCNAGQTQCVAVLDRSLHSDVWKVTALESSTLHDVSDALREAGALDVIVSPRHLGSLAELGRRHAVKVAVRSTVETAAPSITARAWASLPWQAG
jgi:hypothetical protein